MLRCVLVVVVMLAFGAAGASAAAPRSLQVTGPAGRLAGAMITTARSDASGRVFVAADRRIAAFDPTGALAAEWSIPATDTPGAPLLLDVLPDGTVFAAALGGSAVYRFDAAGHALGSWAVDIVQALAADPRGSVVVTDRAALMSNTPAPERFAVDGRPLGRVRGPTGATAIALSGDRWVVQSAQVLGVAPSGRPLVELGRECTVGHTTFCPGGIGAFGATPPTSLAASASGRLAAAEPSLNRVQVFGPRGKVLFACTRILGSTPVTAVGWSGGTVLLGAGESVYRARLSTAARSGCARSSVRLSGLRARHGRVSYRVSARARVELVFTRLRKVPCRTAPADGFDPARGCVVPVARAARRVPGARGAHRVRVRLPAGRWYVQLRASTASGDTADSPLVRVR